MGWMPLKTRLRRFVGLVAVMVRVVSRAAPDDATPNTGDRLLLRAGAQRLAPADQVPYCPNLPAKIRHALSQFPAEGRDVLAEFFELHLEA